MKNKDKIIVISLCILIAVILLGFAKLVSDVLHKHEPDPPNEDITMIEFRIIARPDEHTLILMCYETEEMMKMFVENSYDPCYEMNDVIIFQRDLQWDKRKNTKK